MREAPDPTILVVDDDEVVLEVTAALIECSFEGRVRVLCALGGARALQIARHTPPDVIVCDYWMPVMDGPSLIRQVRQQATLRAVPIILHSSERRIEELARSLDAQGAVGKLEFGALEEELRRHLLPAARNQRAASVA